MLPVRWFFNAIPDLGTTRPDFSRPYADGRVSEYTPRFGRTRRSSGANFPSDDREFWAPCSTRRWRHSAIPRRSGWSGPPRLADFALWVTACEPALGMEPGEVVTACQTNSAEARDLALESSPLYGPLAELAREGFTGTMAGLRTRLDSMVSDAMRRSVRWPKAPNGLGNALRRMATSLRAARVELQFIRNDVQGRGVVSVVGTGQARKTSSVAVRSRQ